MKRSPLRRKTPLRPKAARGATTRPQRRGTTRPRHQSRPDPMPPAEAALVLAREHYTCIARILIRRGMAPPGHECRNQWGEPLRPNEALTIEHVKLHPKLGERAPSHRMFAVAACWGANVAEVWTSAHRDAINAYLDAIYGREAREAKYRELTGHETY